MDSLAGNTMSFILCYGYCNQEFIQVPVLSVKRTYGRMMFTVINLLMVLTFSNVLRKLTSRNEFEKYFRLASLPRLPRHVQLDKLLVIA